MVYNVRPRSFHPTAQKEPPSDISSHSPGGLFPRITSISQYKVLSKNQVPAFADWGVFCRTVALDPSIYLHFLQSQCLSLHVRFRRASVAHIRDAFSVRFGEE